MVRIATCSVLLFCWAQVAGAWELDEPYASHEKAVWELTVRLCAGEREALDELFSIAGSASEMRAAASYELATVRWPGWFECPGAETFGLRDQDYATLDMNRAASRGWPRAEFFLGWMMFNGVEPDKVSQQIDTGIDLLVAASSKGHALADVHLAKMVAFQEQGVAFEIDVLEHYYYQALDRGVGQTSRMAKIEQRIVDYYVLGTEAETGLVDLESYSNGRTPEQTQNRQRNFEALVYGY